MTVQIERVTRDSNDLADVRRELPKLIGKLVHFSNGCDLILENEAGCYWGDSPYGDVLCIELKDGWETGLLNILEYWNEHDAINRQGAGYRGSAAVP